MKRALTILSCLLIGSSAAAQAKQVRKVAVAPFEAPKESRARNMVLSTLSDHLEVEVVSGEDIAFASKRVKADAKTPEGRQKIGAEIGVEYWLDGEIDEAEDIARLTLTTSEGKRVASAEVSAASTNHLEATIGERMWAAMGGVLSTREERRRAFLAAAERAHAKAVAREQEYERQAALVQQRVREKFARLDAEYQLALGKRAGMDRELARQQQLVRERVAAQPAYPTQPVLAQPRMPQPRANGPQQRPMAYSYQTNTAGHGYQQPAQGWAQPAQTKSANNASGVSPATQRWLAQQKPD
jgi:TolB-like protein